MLAHRPAERLRKALRRIVPIVLVAASAHDAAAAQEPEFLGAAVDTALFIYDGATAPCADTPPGTTLLPMGTGFVSGIPKRGTAPNSPTWTGVKFLVTAKHVVYGKSKIIVRLNRKDNSEFTCFPLELKWDGKEENSFVSEKPEVDLAAIYLPKIPDTDPFVIDYAFILDAKSMAAWQVGEGTEVLTIGYLYGYSGKKKNYPVKKFGKIALLTEENWCPNPLHPDQLQRAYLVELQNVPGLSGAPVLLQSPRFILVPGAALALRHNPPLVVGVIKDLMTAPIGPGQVMSQGIAAVEPGSELKALLQQIAKQITSRQPDLELDLPETPAPK
jgi:hypothetical protein